MARLLRGAAQGLVGREGDVPPGQRRTITISYRRRADGARVVLDEGAVCAEIPVRPERIGPRDDRFGDREADLCTTSGGFAAAVDVTENPAWLLTGTGIDRDDFTTIAAKLHLIDR